MASMYRWKLEEIDLDQEGRQVTVSVIAEVTGSIGMIGMMMRGAVGELAALTNGAAPSAASPAAAVEGERKRRGRPPGSTNKPKDDEPIAVHIPNAPAMATAPGVNPFA